MTVTTRRRMDIVLIRVPTNLVSVGQRMKGNRLIGWRRRYETTPRTKRRKELNDESNESDNNMSNTLDDNILGRGSKIRHHKRQRSARGGGEDVGKETRVSMGDQHAGR